MLFGRKERIMKEYIVEFGDALYNEETGEAVFKPKIEGELIRCKDCKYYKENTLACSRYGLEDDDYCSWAERKEE